MGPAGYTVKLEQWEEEDRQLVAAGIPNPYDAYPDDRSKNWLRARSKLVIKDFVAVIVAGRWGLSYKKSFFLFIFGF
jgi:hypothetical protein